MEHSVNYYFGLVVLDALDNETRRVRMDHGTDADRATLRRWAYLIMGGAQGMPPHEDFFMVRFKNLIDEYFGHGESVTLWENVSAIYQMAQTHARERASGGPYTLDPESVEHVVMSGGRAL